MSIRAALVTGATVATGLGISVPPAAALPFGGSFDSPPVSGSFTTYSSSSAPFGDAGRAPWVVTSGTVDHGIAPAGTPCHTSQCVDLNGFTPGAIAQTFDTREGDDCRVSFQMSHHVQLPQGATLVPTVNTVDQAPLTHSTPVTGADGKWEPRTFSFFATGPTTTLGFRTAMLDGGAGPQIDTVSVECRPTGLLKVCKVAGPTVALGQGFNFKANNGPVFAVPAGPAPGGYCVKVGRFPVGSNVVIAETPVSGAWVTSIGVVPANRLVGQPNLAGGSVTVTMGTGVTEATFTNATVKTGYLEVCKEYRTLTMVKPAPMFHFDIPGVPGGVDVPAGACSPALQVAAGPITVTEKLSSGSALTQCATIPSAALQGCDLATGKATVNVAVGGPSTQTVLTFVNIPRQT